MKLIKLTTVSEKRLWSRRFCEDYSGNLVAGFDPSSAPDNESRFFVAEDDGKHKGYIQITNYTNEVPNNFHKEFWSASVAYVKPCYRKTGVLRFMLEECVKSHDVRALRIEAVRLSDLLWYYETLGFVYGRMLEGGNLISLHHNSYVMEWALAQHTNYSANESDYRISA
jgi:predicted N-acetyltransferase YhbS